MSNELAYKNLKLFLSKLENIGVNTEKFSTELGDLLLKASFSLSNENGTAYEGSLLHITLRILTPYAIRINELLPENSRCPVNSIVKVCLLSHIAKCKMFVENDNNWEVEKKGLVYKYNPNNVALKMGALSIMLSHEMGVNFTPEEFEAMTILDRDDDDPQAKFHSSTLSNIVKIANTLTFLQLRNNKNTI